MRDGAKTREKILSEALSIFARHGFEGARMEQIAAQVGINKASLYFYFKSKEEIFHELFLEIIHKYRFWNKNIIDATKGLPTYQRLTGIYQKYLEDSWDNPEMDFWNRIYYFPSEVMKEEIYRTTLETEMEFLKGLTAVFDEGIRRGELRPLDPTRMAKTYYYIMTCISLSVDLFPKELGLKDMENCFAVFWEGVKN